MSIQMHEKPLSPKVEALAGYGISPADIACVLDMPEEELRVNYGRELESSGIKANAKVAESLFRKATGEGRESVVAAIFWLKTRARWKEVQVQEHVGHATSPIKVIISAEDSGVL
ncbi:hypothetical protein [Mesorhizobium sp.]|uniref:hypothetical protein n=1 Tax=Mesorhizobium sp. TaxID=1871066 RepID=UPI00121F90B8|nr:hypothetical protein [Mesorhizobium sp.]TIS63878.1 MAG: hypothetical protein E5W92_25875 [Mesorhizobium sp.]